MNKTLVLHIESDYLIAAVEPLNEKFQLISRRGISRFPFYFLTDEVANKLDYSFIYAEDYKAGKSGYIGEFLSKLIEPNQTYRWYNYDVEIINLLLLILDDIKEAYSHILNNIENNVALVGNEQIPTFLSFSDNVPPKVRFILKDFLSKQNFQIAKDDISIAQLFVNYFLENSNENTEKKIAVLEAYSDNLNMSVVSVYNSYDRERTHFKQFIDFGIDPRIQVISQKIVDDLNRQEGLLPDSDAKKMEYKRQIPIAQKLVMQIESASKPYLQVETYFTADETRKLTTNLEIAEIERLTSFHVRQLSRFFADSFLQDNGMKVEDMDSILLLGNTLCNEIIKKEFSRFGNEKLHYFPSEKINLALHAALSFNKPKPKVEIQESKSETVLQSTQIMEYKEVPYITLSNLKHGQKVKIHGFDPAPGKGASLKELNYLGEMKFNIISSTRTLLPGDICKCSIPVWAPGMQIDFQIERSGKNLGLYKTRPVVKLEIL